jgi:predicted RNA binding protein YcfA (HicA-like mRNA interferase family)
MRAIIDTGGEEMTAKEILKQLKADGWTEKSQRGSHLQLVHPTKPGKVTVPMHSGKDLDPKTANSILKQAGLK